MFVQIGFKSKLIFAFFARNLKTVCKFVSIELEERLKETGVTSEVIQTGYNQFENDQKKRTKYKQSELRLIETMESVCDRMLTYNVHKERTDSTRFARGTSQTFQTLHGLVDRGVKVDLGIPYELWDKPSAEITHLKSQCEHFLEQHEADIDQWYWKLQDIPLSQYLCEQKVLKDKNMKCLSEEDEVDTAKSTTTTKKKNKDEL